MTYYSFVGPSYICFGLVGGNFGIYSNISTSALVQPVSHMMMVQDLSKQTCILPPEELGKRKVPVEKCSIPKYISNKFPRRLWCQGFSEDTWSLCWKALLNDKKRRHSKICQFIWAKIIPDTGGRSKTSAVKTRKRSGVNWEAVV